MTRQYKVGDKVRMLENFCTLEKGQVYEITEVTPDDHCQTCKMAGKWPWTGLYEHLPPEPDNSDLFNNRIPFGRLEPDVQERMEAWEHGHEWWDGGGLNWFAVEEDEPFYDDFVYRAKPAPVAPERVTRWVNVYSDSFAGSIWKERKDADAYYSGSRLAVWKITYDKDTGLNPVIEVEDV